MCTFYKCPYTITSRLLRTLRPHTATPHTTSLQLQFCEAAVRAQHVVIAHTRIHTQKQIHTQTHTQNPVCTWTRTRTHRKPHRETDTHQSSQEGNSSWTREIKYKGAAAYKNGWGENDKNPYRAMTRSPRVRHPWGRWSSCWTSGAATHSQIVMYDIVSMVHTVILFLHGGARPRGALARSCRTSTGANHWSQDSAR